jgi:hypothetical protein
VSNEDFRDRVRRATEKYIIKNDPNRPKRKNQSPEKDLVEKPCLKWMREQGWSVDIIESKATYSPARQRWIAQAAKAGHLDCHGVCANGYPVYIEFKAPGRRGSFRRIGNFRQREFALEKIRVGAFVAVVDSPQLLMQTYGEWLKFVQAGARQRAAGFLASSLP